MIIVLDGSKGAGKSSVARILKDNIDGVVFLSFDEERKLLPVRDETVRGIHKEPFDNIIKKARESLKSGRNIIIDCGLTEERVFELEKLASDFSSKLHKFFLKASYEILLNRVFSRDKAKGKETNVERFDEVHKIVHSKELDGFNIIETDNLSIPEVADKILRIIK